MIKIEEKQTSKLPGITSLFVSFDYNAAIVEAIKTLPNYTYDKKTFTWEIPITSLAKLLNLLNPIDDITLTLLPDKKEKKPKEIVLSDFKTEPYYYQKDGIIYGLQNDRFLLLDSPGLGKTIQLTYLAEELKEREGLEHCLIICGINTLKANWKNEIKRHSKLNCRILGERISKKGKYSIGSVKERLEDLKNPIKEFFIITNIETLRNDDIVKAINKGPNKIDMIVVDEIHTCLKGDSIIQTDQGELDIFTIVNNNINCKVKSYNEITNKIEYNNILNYYKIPYKSNLLYLEFEDHNNIYSINCTPEHKIYTKNRGYVEAQNLNEEDIIEFNKN